MYRSCQCGVSFLKNQKILDRVCLHCLWFVSEKSILIIFYLYTKIQNNDNANHSPLICKFGTYNTSSSWPQPQFLNLIGDLVVTCGYLTVLALLFFQIEIFPVIFNIFLNFFSYIYICARTSMMPPWVLASQLVCDKVVKFNQEKSMHPWNVEVVLQYSRKWWTIKVFQEWKQFTLLRWMKTKYFCERFL